MEAEEATLTEEESMRRLMQCLNATGKPGPTERYLLRIVEEHPHGLAGFPMTGQGVDFMHNGMRQHPQTPEENSDMVKLHEVLDKPKYKDKPFEYEYDFGDCWTHDITVVGRKPATDFFMCTDGEGHGVAEDVGHTPGWERLKAAYRAQRPNKAQRERMEWFEEQASNRDERGLGAGGERRWAKGQVNRRLGELAGKVQGFT